ncbi:MAG: hypothetical protein ACREQE_03835, partial [Candidatus Binataceae bacterium]
SGLPGKFSRAIGEIIGRACSPRALYLAVVVGLLCGFGLPIFTNPDLIPVLYRMGAAANVAWGCAGLINKLLCSRSFRRW